MNESQRGGGMGDTGHCVCVRCGHRQPHERGSPCRKARCPECGAAMLREGSLHHQEALSKGAGGKAKP